MSDQVIRKLLVGVGFKVDDGQLDQVDGRVVKTKKSADAMEGAFRKAAAALAALGLASKAMESIKANLDFEKQLGKIQTLVPENIAQVQSYRKELLDMSQRTGKGLGELADATYEVGSAFGVTADTIAITEMAAKAATAAGAETKDAVNLLSSVTMAYGDTTVDAISKVADLASMTANIGKTSIPEMNAGIGQITGTAKKLGVEQEELFAIIATGSGVLNTAQLLTGFKAAMSSLIKPTTEMRKVYKKLGITAIETEVAQHGLIPTLERITKVTDGTVDATGKLFASEEAMGLVVPLVTNLNGKYREQLMQLTKSEGSAKKAYDASTEGLAKNAHAAELAEAKMAALKVMVGQKLTPTYLEFIDLMLQVSGTFKTAEEDSDRLTGSLQGHLQTLGEFKETVGAIIKFLMSPIIALGKTIDHMLLALKAVTVMVKGGNLDEMGTLGKELGLMAVHGASTAALGAPEMANQLFGGANSGPAAALGFDSKGMFSALGSDARAMRASELNRGVAATANQIKNEFSSTIGALQVMVGAGTPEQIAEQAARATAKKIVENVFRGMLGTLAPTPKAATP